MTITEFKLMSALTIFVAAMVVGLLPTAFSQKHPRAVSISEAIASGIFLGAGLFHMLPDAQAVFQQIGYTHFPYAISLCVASFLLLTIIEQTAKYFADQSSSSLTALLLLFVLSIHSLIAGAALGINVSISNAVVIFIAIIAHKSSASFALVVSLHKSFQKSRTILLMLLLFSLMTPLGILLATSISSALQTDQAMLTEAVFNALTAGTFIYVGALDTMGRQLKPQSLISRIGEFVSLIIGMGLMGFVAIWI